VQAIILIGQEEDWTPASMCNFADKTNVEVTIYPGARHAYAAQGLDMMYLGHHLAYQEEAANDTQRRALAFIRSLSN